MKTIRIIALIFICLSVFTGCDAFRSALGKPTSKDLAALRAQKEQMQRTGDSIAVEMGALPDSLIEVALATGDSSSIEDITAEASVPEISEPQKLVDLPQEEIPETEETPEAEEPPTEGLASGYYVVLGSFKNADNAQYYYNSLSASGAEVHLVKMKNGFTAVMICHGNTYDEAYSKMLEFYSDKKRPEDIWIYNTAKKMHIE